MPKNDGITSKTGLNGRGPGEKAGPFSRACTATCSAPASWRFCAAGTPAIPARPGAEQGGARQLRFDDCMPHASSAGARGPGVVILGHVRVWAGAKDVRSHKAGETVLDVWLDLFGRYQKVLHSALDSLDNLNRPDGGLPPRRKAWRPKGGI